MLEQLQQLLQELIHNLPSWNQVLIALRDHYAEIIVGIAILELFLAFIVFVYNRRYIRKVDRWFRNDVLKDCSKPSSMLSRWLQVEHLLHTFRVEYVKKLDDKSQESLKEEYYKLTNEKAHSIYAYNKWVRTFFNLFFDLIPMFPMLGILGTVVAIACQFSVAQEVSDQAEAILTSVTKNFGMAILTSIYGIGFAIGFTVINAMFIESGTQKCFEVEKTARKSLDDVLRMITMRQRSHISVGKSGGASKRRPSQAPEKSRKSRRRNNGD
jgi:biopolymer transport protein ExbB/TolQ